ncbi:hypothetical protein EGR_08060 [Echinococcus granulosus]|uniref:Ornithine decarboxylase antizyme n=2 Tax=Echinococcus granulosus TaxID=6210 RepID=W6U969_ECHGR|nr:hypothetical protein EGR_08060 [Echinococcus granulosus]EUB57051.1 hypothetical protein EGR_08060 [Echinococcus granulosus]
MQEERCLSDKQSLCMGMDNYTRAANGRVMAAPRACSPPLAARIEATTKPHIHAPVVACVYPHLPVPGLGRIFDISCGALSFGSRPVGGYGSKTVVDGCLELTDAPKQVSLVEVGGLNSVASMEILLASEGRRGKTEWLVVYVRGSTTAMLFLPRETRRHSSVHCGLAMCMEWLEAVGMSQILVALPTGEEALFKNLLFLGFSRVSKAVVTGQLPSWCDGYTLLITDLAKS